jgi:hypothetical protein
LAEEKGSAVTAVVVGDACHNLQICLVDTKAVFVLIAAFFSKLFFEQTIGGIMGKSIFWKGAVQ